MKPFKPLWSHSGALRLHPRRLLVAVGVVFATMAIALPVSAALAGPYQTRPNCSYQPCTPAEKADYAGDNRDEANVNRGAAAGEAAEARRNGDRDGAEYWDKSSRTWGESADYWDEREQKYNQQSGSGR